MDTSIKLNNYTIVNLTNTVLVGKRDDGRELLSSPLLYIDFTNLYAVTVNKIYKLVNPDNIWVKTEDFNNKIREWT